MTDVTDLTDDQMSRIENALFFGDRSIRELAVELAFEDIEEMMRRD